MKSKAVKIFAKPNDRIEPIRDVFESQYKENKGSKMQGISLTKKIIHWFMNKIIVKKRGIIRTADFSTLVNRQVQCKIRNLVSIVKMFEKKEDKPCLLFNLERPDVDTLEDSTWVINAKIYINSY